MPRRFQIEDVMVVHVRHEVTKRDGILVRFFAARLELHLSLSDAEQLGEGLIKMVRIAEETRS